MKHLQSLIPEQLFTIIKERGIFELRPCQKKAIDAGLLQGKNLLICTPTASGKTLVAELAMVSSILHNGGKAVYIVPLKALASEKYKEMKRSYSHLFRVALSIGDMDKPEPGLSYADLIILTSEKLDSLIRHNVPWVKELSVIVVDEVHLMNDVSRGPTLEVILTLLRQILPKAQIVALSATIGNPEELAKWLNAKLIIDFWRPVELRQGVFIDNKIKKKGN